MKKFIIDPTSDLCQNHSLAIIMATLIYNGFNLCEPITLIQEKEGIGNLIFTQELKVLDGESTSQTGVG